MKKAVYSYAAKTIAFILIIASAALGTYKAVSLLLDISSDYEEYRFESDFYHSDAFEQAIILPMGVMINFNNNDDAAIIAGILADSQAEYFMEADGNIIFSNSKNPDPEYFSSSKYSLMAQRYADGEITLEGSMADKVQKDFIENYYNRFQRSGIGEECRVYVRADDEYMEKLERNWHAGQERARSAVSYCFSSFLIFILSLIYLLCVCGRRVWSGNVSTILIDRMFVEINLGFIAITSVLALYAVIALTELLIEYGSIDRILSFVIPAAAGMWAALETTLLMSLMRNLKNKTFLKYSLIVRVFNLLCRLCKKMWANLKKTAGRAKELFYSFYRLVCRDKLAAMTVLAFAAYTFVLFIGGVIMIAALNEDEAIGVFFVLIIMAAFFAVSLYQIFKRLKAFDKIKDGIFQIRSGNIEYKISGVTTGVSGLVAEAVNNIGDGLSESVKTKIKAERMKAELITNVSHDLKTPLTSIINYTNLLTDMELEPNEANDYVAVLKGKSERLKNLTQDLFDISKAQSGNEQIYMEKLDISLLIRQTLGELDEMIKSSGLTFVSELKEEMFIRADGKKMSRVFENLIINAVKYSMKNTRVYVSVSENHDRIITEIKNISAYPIDFDVREITERFVRGDESRTAEGNGLGLAIAKSYTELCGGEMEILTDGDLFKARIIFDKNI